MSFTQDPGAGAAAPLPPPPPAASGLFRGVHPSALSLGTAIEVAFRALAKPAFVVPIFIVAIVINIITEIALGPTLAQWRDFTATSRATLEEINQLIGALGVSLLISLIGGAIAAIYGTVWVVAASIGPSPTVGETFALVRRRWVGVLGASLVVGAITLGCVTLGAIVVAFLAKVNAAVAFGVATGLIVAFIWLVARLYMTTWLAADGVGVVPSVQGSWRITEGSVLRIVGWTLAYGFLFALIAAAAGLVLDRVPYVGQGIATGLTLALGYGAGVTLFRRTQASATPPAGAPTAPPVSEAPLG